MIEPNRQNEWQDTRLWEALAKRDDGPSESVKLVLARVLPEVEQVLDHGDSMPGNFTLHDTKHSHRVAERIADIAGDLLSKLSSYELGLLLLAAYLHDIGMTPPVERVASHFVYLLTADPTTMTRHDQAALQTFLDDNWDGLTPPLTHSAPSAMDIATASQVTAEYVRERHASWGEEWIRQNLGDLENELYSDWIEDLVLLCRSHHFGFEQLSQHDFDPRLIGTTGAVCHLRFSACLLRVADVLDFDPERTPSILFRHRGVGDPSAIFWHKDHGIGFDLEDGRITIQAQPPNAIIHNAIIRTVEDVERELVLCDRLAAEKPFNLIAGSERLPHRWRLNSHVQRFIEPRNERYEYVDGTFRPDPRRVIDLIGGVALYGSELVTVRELLQNAFDAVREQIARERLSHPEPGADATREEIARTHRVVLRLERRGEEVHLSCRDTGSGMSKDLLLSRFLVGGKTANHAVRELERQCKAQGFSVGRTARFGIGVLSYFLLGRHLQVDTRRSIEAGDRDGVGWTFTSQGLDDFGELRKNLVCGKGTMLTLTVRGSVMKSGYGQFAESLRDYIEQTVRRVPCHFSFEVTDSGLLPLVLEPGWAGSEDRFRRVALKELRQRRSASTSVELLPREERERFSEEDSYWKEIRERAGDALFFLQRTGELPEGLGVYRLTLSRFQIGDEKSLAYLELSDGDGDSCVQKIDNQDAHLPSQEVVTSWNGMDVQGGAQYVYGYARTSDGREPSNIFLEVDWTSDAAGRLAVDRNSVQFSQAADKAIDDLLAEAISNLQELIDESPTSPIAFLNARMLSLPPPTENLVIWPTGRESRLEPLVAPLRCVDTLDSSDGEETLLWRGQEVRATRPIVVNRRDAPRHLVHWNGRLFRPLGMGFRSGGPWGRPSVIWSLDRLASGPALPGDLSVEFPPSWSDVFACQTPTDLIWNRDHPLVQHIDEDSWEWARTIMRGQDPLEIEAAILSSSGRTAAWVANHVRTGSPDIWRGLIERREDFLQAVWGRIGLKSEEAVRFLACRRDTVELRCGEPHTFVLPGNRRSTVWLRETTVDLEDRWWLTTADTVVGADSAANDQ